MRSNLKLRRKWAPSPACGGGLGWGRFRKRRRSWGYFPHPPRFARRPPPQAGEVRRTGTGRMNEKPPRQTMTTPIAVTIAGSDSSGGAGIQADLKTFEALGVYGATVIAALTAQNTKGVTAIHEVPPDFVTAQIDAVFADLAVGAVKIGMLGNAAVAAAVADGLKRHRPANIVLDPVMVSSSGRRLLAPDAFDVLRTQLMPGAVITPNLPEAAALTDD